MTEKGLSLGVVINQLATILIALFTKYLIHELGGHSLGSGRLFMICGGLTAVTALFVILFVKETKGLTELEVAQLYSREKASLLQVE